MIVTTARELATVKVIPIETVEKGGYYFLGINWWSTEKKVITTELDVMVVFGFSLSFFQGESGKCQAHCTPLSHCPPVVGREKISM